MSGSEVPTTPSGALTMLHVPAGRITGPFTLLPCWGRRVFAKGAKSLSPFPLWVSQGRELWGLVSGDQPFYGGERPRAVSEEPLSAMSRQGSLS